MADWHGADLGLWAANMLVIDGKMRTLFSMLFGASMLLVIERAEAAGQIAARKSISGGCWCCLASA